MKNTLLHRVSLIVGSIALAGSLQAQLPVGSHYPVGAEGIKGGSLPPPGVYLRDYNFFYTSDRVAGLPVDADIFAYVQAPRLIWITKQQILGADYGMDIIVPFFDKELHGALGGRNKFGLGDLQLEPVLLSWHEKKFDVAAGYALWVPTGSFESDSALHFLTSPGNGFWTHMFTLGGTYYADEEKTIALSLLNRYEINTRQAQTGITPGNMWTPEWGASKTVYEGIDVGLIGYYQDLITHDSGVNAARVGSHVTGVGPEVSALIKPLGMFGSLRYAYEVDAANRPQGQTITLTLTKPF